MKNSIVQTAFVVAMAACGFVFTLGLTNRAHAYDVWVELDNFSNPGGALTGGGTTNTISVSVKYCGNAFYTFIGARALNSLGGHNFSWVASGTTVANQVDKIYVTISGSDLFWIDQISLWDNEGGGNYRHWYEGGDNEVGVCLSTDPTDGDDGICEPDGATASYTFDVSGPFC